MTGGRAHLEWTRRRQLGERAGERLLDREVLDRGCATHAALDRRELEHVDDAPPIAELDDHTAAVGEVSRLETREARGGWQPAGQRCRIDATHGQLAGFRHAIRDARDLVVQRVERA